MRSWADDKGMAEAETDPRFTYPCYKSFDKFIDVGRLKSLDAPLAGRIGRYVREGERMILLTETARPSDYYAPDQPELWRPTEAAREFPELMEFVATLPFEATGRIFIMTTPSPGACRPTRTTWIRKCATSSSGCALTWRSHST